MEFCKHTKYRNGQRKIKALLKQEYNIELNRSTVQRLMQKHNLQCRIKPKRN
ncbi:IS3 family transposase [Sporosarcina sp. P7]|uniref:IS3 family transposase n=1 Tax=unclassified Sporosarcina TaxID=2647733 RepID=UPI00117E4472